jgi:ankyrin repeat protein/beta-lactamase regulating signal transducer with metallopeptidase domain
VWQSTIFIAVGLVGSFILRHRSSRAHQVLFLSMIAAVIVPIMSILVKHYELGMFVAEPVAIQSPAENLGRVGNYGAPGFISAENIEHKPGLIERDLPSALAGSESAKFPWSSVMLYLWIAGSLILATRLLVTFVLGVRILGQAPPLDCQRIKKALNLARAKLGIDKDVSICSSQGISSPVIWCWRRRPILLVPSAAAAFENGVDWAGVLCHELAHWKRRDHISGLLAELMVCILPWHPLLWWAKSRLVKLSEQACDDWVVATGQPGTDYAESLLDLIPGGQMAFVPAVVSSKRGLAGRIRRILQDNCCNPRTGTLWALTVSIVVVCLTVGVACAQTRPAKTKTATKHHAKYTEALIKAAVDGDIEQVKSLIAKNANVNLMDNNGQTPLHYAAGAGHRHIVEFLITRGADVNAMDKNGETPLYYAGDAGWKNVAELLIAQGADVNARNPGGETPLHSAAWGGREDVAKLLIAKGADVMIKDQWDYVPLHAAAETGLVEVAELLIAKGNDPDAKDKWTRSPMSYAIKNGQTRMVEVLIDNGADVNFKDKWGYSPLHWAVWSKDSKDNKDIIRLLINKGTDVNVMPKNDSPPLHFAVWWNKDVESAKLLVNNGAKFNLKGVYGVTAFQWAVNYGNRELVDFFIEKGAKVSDFHFAAWRGDLTSVRRFLEQGTDVNIKDDQFNWTPLHWATFTAQRDIAEFLIAKGANVNAGALHYAAVHGHRELAELLLSKGAEVNAKGNGGRTPLHNAARKGRREVVALLIAKGADVNAKQQNGRTSLHLAVDKGYKKVVKLLIAKGADINAKDENGWTPLHQACTLRRKDIAELLIAKGADIYAKNQNGRTPLHVSCIEGHKNVVELLIAKGAEVNAKSKIGSTALSLAKDRGWLEIINLLRKHGAKE